MAAASPEVEVQTLDGQTLAGPLAELSAGRVAVEGRDGRVSIDTDRLLGISPQPKPAVAEQTSGVWIELVDGSAVAARDYTAKDGQARFTLGGGEVLRTPTRDVASVRFQPPTGGIAAEWARLRGAKLDGDVVLIRSAENVDYHKGVLHDVTDAAVQFELDSETIPITRTKTFGLIYYHAADRGLPEPVCHLTDTAGSRWSVRSIELADGLRWTTPAGVVVARPWDTLVQLDFSGGKIVYLSDVKAESAKWTPYFGLAKEHPAIAEFFAPRMDQNLASKPLQLGGKPYAKGVALHSRTEIAYRLPGRFSRFKATAGIDDGVRPLGNVRLLIRGDDKVLLESTLTGADPPQPIDLDLSGVSRLVILADFGDEMDIADHLDLCEARVLK
jgi:hypothetical protein